MQAASAYVCPLPGQVVEFHFFYGLGLPLEKRLVWGLLQNTAI